MEKRRAARILALLALYQLDVGGASLEQALEAVFSPTADEALKAFFTRSRKVPKATDIGADDGLRGFVARTVEGTWKQREALDQRIREHSEHWRPERMSRTDLNILRMAAFELGDNPQKDVLGAAGEKQGHTPAAVAVNEAVELAKAFGEDETGKFVNGILGAMIEVNEHGHR